MRHAGTTLLAVLVVILGWPVLAQTQTERIDQLERELAASRREVTIRRGGKIFRRSCAACHGREGRGNGPAADDLVPRPRDFTTVQYRFRSTPNGQPPLPEDLVRTIQRGLPGTHMPAFGKLFSEEELGDLAVYLHSLQSTPPPSAVLPEAVVLSEVPAATDQSVDDGRALFLLVGCWRCHGIRGAGNGPSAKTLTDDLGNRIFATDFRYDPLKGGSEPIDVVRALRTGLNGTPMPSYDEAMLLSNEDVGDTASLEGRLRAGDERLIEHFLASSPTPGELESMSANDKGSLRDRRVAALAHYVLSLSRRKGGTSWLFYEEPEKEPR